MNCFIFNFSCILIFSLYLTSCLADDDITLIESETLGSKNYSSAKLVRLRPRSREEVLIIAEKLSEFTNDSADFWTEPSSSLNPVDFMIDGSMLPLIKQFTSLYNMSDADIVLDSVQRAIDSNTMTTRKFAEYRSGNDLELFFRSFQRIQSIYDYLNQLARAYPSLVTIDSIGKSFEKRDLKIIRISSSRVKNRRLKRLREQRSSVKDSGKQIIFVDAGIHAREWLAPATALYLAYSLASKYGKDATITKVVDAFDFVILPSVNPDGYEYSHQHDRMWRKTRSRNSYSRCVGVDPNRNFDFHWKESGSSSRPCSEIFAGPRAFSEVETRAMADYIYERRRQIRVYISLHSYSQMWLYPWGYKADRTSSNPILETKAKVAVNAIKKVYGTSFKYGSSAAVLYPAAGGSDDWALGVCGIRYAYTVELRPTSGSSTGFLVSPNEIIPSGIETTAGIVALAKDIIDRGDAVH